MKYIWGPLALWQGIKLVSNIFRLTDAESVQRDKGQLVEIYEDDTTNSRMVAISSPFRMKAILQACPQLFKRFEDRPFELIVVAGNVKVDYLG